jgi:hypothetical protein
MIPEPSRRDAAAGTAAGHEFGERYPQNPRDASGQSSPSAARSFAWVAESPRCARCIIVVYWFGGYVAREKIGSEA